MPESELMKIADNAGMVVNGYAFTKKGSAISILNLNNPDSAMVIARDGKILETNMSPIEQVLVLNYWAKNSVFMEDADA